jgi:hypothetical protein
MDPAALKNLPTNNPMRPLGRVFPEVINAMISDQSKMFPLGNECPLDQSVFLRTSQGQGTKNAGEPSILYPQTIVTTHTHAPANHPG